MRCRGLQGFANTAYLEGFPFPGLLSVAPYRAPGGIRVVSVGRAGCDNFTLPCHFKFLSPLFACFDLLVCQVAVRLRIGSSRRRGRLEPIHFPVEEFAPARRQAPSRAAVRIATAPAALTPSARRR